MAKVKAHINPFPGIRSFETEESHLFFGRESQIDNILSVLFEAHFLAIIGSSGSGKSSLIRAGVIPAILNTEFNNQKNWEITVFKPGDNPMLSFATEYAQTFNRGANTRGDSMIGSSQAEGNLRNDSEPIINAHQRLGSVPWLIVIDQFEEIFRYHKKINSETDKDEPFKFVNLFLDLIGEENFSAPIYVVLTMRSDFLDSCTEIPGLTEALNKGHFLIPRMTPQQLQDAIVKPIKAVGDQITGALVDRLIEDLGDHTDQLPVMQHALMRAWDYWNINRIGDQAIDILHYEAVGTITSALSLHAEEIFNLLKNEEQKNYTEKLFKALTDLGAEKRGTRRPTAFGDILMTIKAPENDLIEIIDQFRGPGRAFLMPPHNIPLRPETVIDISHESIMRVWERLKEWVDEETKSAELYLRLSKSAELYQQGRSGLWTNPELEIGVKWKQKNKPTSYWAERYDPGFERAIDFLDYSKKESDFEIKRKESRHKRELSRARKIAIFLSIASILSLMFLVISLNLKIKAEASEVIVVKKGIELKEESKKSEIQRKEAISQKRIAEQQQKIAEQQKLVTEEQRKYAIEQQEIALIQKQKADLQKQKAEEAKVIAENAKDEAEKQKQKAISQKLIADSEREKAEKSEKNALRLRLLAIARSMAIESSKMYKTIGTDLPALLALQAYHFNKNNNGPQNDPSIYSALSNIADKKLIFRGHQDAIRGISLTPDSSTLISCSDDGTVGVWDINDPGKPYRKLNSNFTNSGYRCIAVSPDGKFLVAGCVTGQMLLWDITGKNPIPVTINAHLKIVNKIVFDKSGKSCISISSDGTLKIWNISTPEVPTFTYSSDSKLLSLVLGNNGKTLICGDEKGTIRIFDFLSPGEKPIEFQTDGSAIRAIGLDQTNTILAVGNPKGIIRLYSLDNLGQKPIELIGHSSGINSIRFSPDGKTIASCSFDKTVRLWNFEDLKEQPVTIEDNDSWVMDLVFSSDGKKIYACSDDKTIRQWITSSDLLALQICEKVKRNLLPEEWKKYVGKDINYEKTCPSY